MKRVISSLWNSLFAKGSPTPLDKWLEYGFDPTIFSQFPEFSLFLLKSQIASQMKITGEVPRLEAGEPALFCEGYLLTHPQLIERFSSTRCSLNGEKVLREKATSKIYTYLGGGQGLVPYDPYQSFFKHSLTQLSSKDFTATKERAALFGKEGEHIVQIVSCATGEGRQRSRHVYLRLITSDRHVYSFGFNYQKPFNLPCRNHLGLLRSPDIWEYHQRCQKTVTSLLISDEEKERLRAYISSHFLEEKKPVFNLMSQNCALFVKEALLYCCGIKIPTRSLPFSRVFRRISSWIQGGIHRVFPRRSLLFKPILRVTEQLVRSSIEICLSVLLSLVGLVCGAAMGIRGKRLTQSLHGEEFTPLAKNIDWWLNLDAKEIHFPGRILRWQKEQASTESFDHALRLAL